MTQLSDRRSATVHQSSPEARWSRGFAVGARGLLAKFGDAIVIPSPERLSVGPAREVAHLEGIVGLELCGQRADA